MLPSSLSPHLPTSPLEVPMTQTPTRPQDFGEIQLEVNNIEVVYHDIVQVLRGVSLSVPRGKIVALLGTNGAGKTTTLRAISGLLKPENGAVREGYVRFDGETIPRQAGPGHRQGGHRPGARGAARL